MQRYLDNIKTKTGKNINDFREMAEKKGLIKSRDIVAWLTDEFAMENVYAQAIANCLNSPEFKMHSK